MKKSDQLRRRRCTGKVPYHSERDAKVGLARLRSRTGTKDAMNVYRCGFCSRWHFGHPPARLRRRVVEREAA